MFDPAALGASLQPGDKVAMTFHKGQPKPGSNMPSFMDNLAKSGTSEPLSGMGQMPPVGAAPMGVPANDPSAERQALMQTMRLRMMPPQQY